MRERGKGMKDDEKGEQVTIKRSIRAALSSVTHSESSGRLAELHTHTLLDTFLRMK